MIPAHARLADCGRANARINSSLGRVFATYREGYMTGTASPKKSNTLKTMALSAAIVFASTSTASAQGGLKPDIVTDDRAGPFIAKVCSPFVPNAWRSMTIVAFSWTAADCQAFARSVGATTVHLGCLFETAPSAGAQKFAWGRPLGASSTPNAQSLPTNNCGWRAS
jgi:hypothetical protein